MDKQKQIEEMAKVVRKYYSGFSEYKVAEELYRILIPENAVVLTKDGKAKLLHEMYEQGKFDGVFKFSEMLKQLATKEIARTIFDEFVYYRILEDKIDEICKELTGGK